MEREHYILISCRDKKGNYMPIKEKFRDYNRDVYYVDLYAEGYGFLKSVRVYGEDGTYTSGELIRKNVVLGVVVEHFMSADSVVTFHPFLSGSYMCFKYSWRPLSMTVIDMMGKRFEIDAFLDVPEFAEQQIKVLNVDKLKQYFYKGSNKLKLLGIGLEHIEMRYTELEEGIECFRIEITIAGYCNNIERTIQKTWDIGEIEGIKYNKSPFARGKKNVGDLTVDCNFSWFVNCFFEDKKLKEINPEEEKSLW